MNLQEITLQRVTPSEQKRFQSLMETHHYLGSLRKIGHTLWYVVSYKNEWLALISFSAASWKCAARDQWIGWHYRYQYDRLHLIANNSRFLTLPEHHYPNLASRILSLCERRISQDGQNHFSYPLLLLETFVDPLYFHGTIYRAANWTLPVIRAGFVALAKATAQLRNNLSRSLCALYHHALKLDYLNLFLTLVIAMEHQKSC